MNMQTVDLLLLFNQINQFPPPPPGGEYWVDSSHEFMTTDSGDFFVFNPGS
jgi:hypothetical protein